MLKETATAVATAFAFSPLGMPLLLHGFAGLVVGSAGLHLVNGVINDIKGAGDALQRNQNQNPSPERENQQ